MAYCLLGLFGVNMPLIYGEGDILRLLIGCGTHILEEYDDESLLAWEEEGLVNPAYATCTLGSSTSAGARGENCRSQASPEIFARTPQQFRRCGGTEFLEWKRCREILSK